MPVNSLYERQQLGTDITWRARCEVAAVQAASAVMSESAATAGHEIRATYANKVLNMPSTMSGPIAMAVASQPGITGPEASDSDIQFTINSLWDGLSGYSAAP